MFEYPVGTIVKVKKDAAEILAVIVGYFPLSKNKYAIINVMIKNNQFVPLNSNDKIFGERGIYPHDGSNIIGLGNIWPLDKKQVSYLINNCSVDANKFFYKMDLEISKYNERKPI